MAPLSSVPSNRGARTPCENVGDNADLVDRNQRVASRDENVHKRTAENTENAEPSHRGAPAILFHSLCFFSLRSPRPLRFVYSCCDVCKICRVTSKVSRCFTSVSSSAG